MYPSPTLFSARFGQDKRGLTEEFKYVPVFAACHLGVQLYFVCVDRIEL